MNNTSLNSLPKNSGMTLIETLISVFLLAIGILGVMNLQVRSLQASNQTMDISSATLLSEDLIERIRSNYENRALYDFDDTVVSGCDSPPAATPGLPVATLDIQEWRFRVGCELNDATVSVTVNNETVTVFLEWQSSADNTLSHTVTTTL